MKIKGLCLIIVFLVGGVFSGCSFKFKDTLKEANQAIEEARSSGADKKCPEDFQKTISTRDSATRTYVGCNTAEGIKLAQQAKDMAKGLCPSPAKPAAVTAPPPPPPPSPPPPPPAPEPAPQPKPMTRIILEGINFANDSAKIENSSTDTLNRAARILKDTPRVTVRIEGHTDNKASDAHNKDLSERRAKAVKDYLVKNHSIDPNRMTTQGFGESTPIASNDTKEGRAKNRRIEFVITGGN